MNLLKKLIHSFTHSFEKRYHKHYHPDLQNRYLHIIVDILMIVFVLFFAGLVIWSALVFLKAGNNDNLKVDINFTPSQIISADEVSIRVRVKNRTQKLLQNLRMRIFIPGELNISSIKYLGKTLDYSVFKKEILLGDLGGGQEKIIDIQGQILASLGDHSNILFKIIYLDQGKTKEEVFSKKFFVSDSLLKFKLNFPSKITAGQDFQARIQYKNLANSELKDVYIELNLPKQMQLKEGKKIWKIEKIQSKEQKELVLKGNMRILDKQIPFVDIVVKAFIDKEQKTLLQFKKRVRIKVIYPRLKLSLFVVDPRKGYFFGEKINFKLTYQNKEDFDLKNLNIKIIDYQNYLDWTTLSSKEKGFLTSNGSKFIIDKVIKGQSDDLEFAVSLKKKTGRKSDKVLIGIQAEYQGKELFYKTSPEVLIFKINSRIILEKKVLFFTEEGDQLGRGTYPPRVGSKTRYWVFLSPRTDLHRLKDVEISIRLAKGVRCINQGISNCGKYDLISNTSKINLVKISPNFSRKIALMIEILASKEDLAKRKEVIRGIYVEGIDVETGDLIKQNFGKLFIPDKILPALSKN